MLFRSPNVTWLGSVARNDLPALYKRASCLLCTSIYEGFPNTFLEAWSLGKPVVTTFDPDQLVRSLGLGAVGANADDLAAKLAALLSDESAWNTASVKARRYFAENHRVEVAMPRFETLFQETCQP